MARKTNKPAAVKLEDLSEQHRQMVAEGLATQHRFAARPAFRDGKPAYTDGSILGAIIQAKKKRQGRK